MKRIILFIAAFLSSAVALANDSIADKVELRGHRIFVNGLKLNVVRQYDGKRIDLYSEAIFEISGKNPGLFLSFFPDKVQSKEWQPSTEHIIITDATGSQVHQSNVLNTGIDFQWGDNNYVIFEGDAMFFGIYSPKRMQFVYRDGVLEENKGPWRGPAKPEIYIEPTGKDPCFNVNGVEACREELEREKAARQAKQKRKSTAPATLR